MLFLFVKAYLTCMFQEKGPKPATYNAVVSTDIHLWIPFIVGIPLKEIQETTLTYRYC